MTRLLIVVLAVACTTSYPAVAQSNDDCTPNFIGHVRSQFQSQIATAEPIKIFVLLSKRVNTPAGTTQVYVTCDAPHVGKGSFSTDPTSWDWEPRFALTDDPNPIPPRVASALDEYYPTTRPFLDQDRSFVHDGEKDWEIYPPDLESPNCYYYYSDGERKKYCW